MPAVLQADEGASDSGSSQPVADPEEARTWAEHVAALEATLFRPAAREIVLELDGGQLIRRRG